MFQRLTLIRVTRKLHLLLLLNLNQHQLNLRKRAADGATRVEAAALSRDQRREELARMLGGVDITDKTLELAGQMLDANPA